MIPVQLTIEGIYSYQTRQTIDFSQLTEAGLFGVFGTVGSGKSSVLEAITFSLYGNSDRLGSTNFAYNMMNLKSNRLWIEFEFLNFENKTFKITREYRRNSKRFENITNVGVMLYEKVDGEWIPQESANVEPIIGLSSENFRRTIIIPQGQFREFIELKPTARTQMMKEIFNLHKFDLQQNIAELNKANRSALDQLEGQLMGFETVSEEEMNSLNEQLQAAQKVIHDRYTHYQEVNERFNRLKSLKDEIKEWKEKQTHLVRLESEEERYNALEKELTQFERIQTTFFTLLQEMERIEKDWSQKKNALVAAQTKLEQSQELEVRLVKEMETLKPAYDTLDEKKQQLNELEYIQRIQKAQRTVIENEARLKDGDAFLAEQKQREEFVLKEINELELNIEQLAQQQIPTVDLVELESWYKTYADLQLRIVSLENKRKEQLQNQPELDGFVQQFGLNVDGLENQLLERNSLLQKRKDALEEQRSQLEVKRKLANYTHELVDGQPCPLCGSAEHPSIAEAEDVSKQMEEVLNALQQNSVEMEQWKKIIADIDKKEQEIHFFNQRLKEDDELLMVEKAKQEKMVQSFRWTEYSPTDTAIFESKKKVHYKNEELKNEKADQLKVKRSDLVFLQQNVEKAKNRIQELQSQLKVEQKESDMLLGMLTQLKWEDYQQSSIEDLTRMAEEWTHSISQLEQSYQRVEKDLANVKIQLSGDHASLEQIQLQVKELQAKWKQSNQELTKRLALEKLSDLAEVKEILDKNIAVAELRSNIQAYRVQLLSLKATVETFEKKLKDVEWKDEMFEQEQLNFQQAEQAYKEATEAGAKVEEQLTRLRQQFEEKRELMEKFAQLQKRQENLNLFANMFRSAGFVEFVSSIYLKQLCAHANHRFHRMTRNQLSLQLGDSGFEIIDYLNEGKSRSVRTLSGGQAFQVSLCLALALAESVQANSKANRNFFFIDEGFGTQDSESVNIVFETLTSLVKENRIVGIISHVEELKERIPISLHVEKDPEKGSLIQIVN